jgi:hypothetical protein
MKRQLHLAIEIFELILSGNERDKKHAVALIRKLDATARRDLHFPGHRERRIRPIVNTESGAS